MPRSRVPSDCSIHLRKTFLPGNHDSRQGGFVFRYLTSLTIVAVTTVVSFGALEAQNVAKPAPAETAAPKQLHAVTNTVSATPGKLMKWSTDATPQGTDSIVTEGAAQLFFNMAPATNCVCLLDINGVTRGEDRFEVRKGGSDSWGGGSGFFLGTSTGDFVGTQLSAVSNGYYNMDFWVSNGGGPYRLMTLRSDTGKVGIGTAAPDAKLEVVSMDAKGALRLDGGDTSNGGYGSVQMALGFNNSWNYAHFIRSRHNGGTADSNAIDFYTSDGTQTGVFPTNAVHGLTIMAGKIGVAQIHPNYNVDVTGTGHFTGDLTVDGNITGAKVFNAVYQDVAEWVPASTHMAPGTVVVLNHEHENEVMPSASAYDTSVAGVVSAQPGVLLGVPGDSKAQVATTGRVKVHVDATRGAIAIGDLLVTSDKPGMAMKSQPIDLGGVSIHRPGTVIGKALQPLASGEGEILVLLSLQ
jgi:hypothetical protein